MNNQKIIKCKLNGEQSYSVPIDLKKNGKNLTESVDVIVRGFLKFDESQGKKVDFSDTDTYQRDSANLIDDRTIVYPVLFTNKRITVNNGRLVVTLLPRSEDILQNTDTILPPVDRQSLAVLDTSLIEQAGVKSDESLTDPKKEPARIVIETGVIRTPYKVSIEITVIDDSYYAQTVDRGVEGTIPDDPNNSIFSHNRTSLASNLIIDFYNDEEWIPFVESLLETDNEGTSSEILNKIDSLSNSTPFGASPMYDALSRGVEVMSDELVRDIRKLMYLFTDNESNLSIKNIDEVLAEIDALVGNKKMPIIVGNLAIVDPLTLSAKNNISDTKDLIKLSSLTGGQSVTIISSSYLDDVVEIFSGEATGSLGYGTCDFTVDMGEEVLISSLMANFILPLPTTNGNWSISTSKDGYNFTSLDKTYNANQEVYFEDLYIRYIRFNIVLVTGFGYVIGSEYLSNIFPYHNYIKIVYNKYNVVYLYLNLEEDDIIPSQLTLGVDSSDVNMEQIEIGVAKSDSHNWMDFYNASQLEIDQNGKIVIPLRFSQDINEFSQEPLRKVDNFTLKTEYGAWDPTSSVFIYDKNDSIFSIDNYRSYPRDGIIIFSSVLDYNYQDGDYKIGIVNNNNYKIGLKLTNKSIDNALEIFGIGYLYTTSKDLLPPLEKIIPEARDIIVTPDLPKMYDPIEFSYVYYDSNYDKENISKRIIKWYINDIYISYLDNLTKWNDPNDPNDPLYKVSFTFPTENLEEWQTIEGLARQKGESILKVGDKVHCIIQVSDGTLFSSPTKSNIIEVKETKPLVTSVEVKGQKPDGSIIDRVSSNNAAIAVFFFYSDTKINVSEIIWYVNGEEFKRGIWGITEGIGRILPGEISVSTLDVGLKMLNEIYVTVVPQSDTSSGEPLTSETVVVKNSLPTVSDVALVPVAPTEHQDLILTWNFYDFEILALDDPSQSDMTTVKWYRQNPGSPLFEEVTDENSLANINTDLGTHTSTVDSSITIPDQQWYAKVIPSDSLDEGETVESRVVVIYRLE